MDDWEQAGTYYRQAMGVARELGMRPLHAFCHRGLGRLEAGSRDPGESRERLATAAAMFREMGYAV
jgi:hypothetical protein